MKTKLLLAATAIVLLFTSCVDDYFIEGNGIPASENRLVNGFTTVASEGNFQVHITPGESYEVLVKAESNLLPFIQTDVNGQHLRIHVRGMHNLQNQFPVEIFITAPFIEGVVQSGSGIITTGRYEGETFSLVVSGSGSLRTSVDADWIEAVLSGSGNLFVSGQALDASLIVSGSGRMNAWDLAVRNCDAKISGSGDVWVDVEEYLKAVISGSGNVFYSGTPVVETVVSGSGGVIHKN